MISHLMISFSQPADQNRLNATVYELIRMRFVGTVYIDGEWDAYDALTYLEERLRVELIPTLRTDGSLFRLNGKYVLFSDDGVIVTTSLSEIKEAWSSDS
jgi:hypothetical protein